MTRADTLARAADLWQEVMGSESWGDPIGADRELSTVADELARVKKVWYGSRFLDLVAGQSVYLLSNTFELKGVSVGRGVGYASTPISLMGASVARQRGVVFSGLTSGTVATAVDAGQTLYLAPPSFVSVSDGLELLGFHNPGTGAYCLWPLRGDQNPLPHWTHETCALGLAAARASLYVGSVEFVARAGTLTKRFEIARRGLDREAHRQFERLKTRGSSY